MGDEHEFADLTWPQAEALRSDPRKTVLLLPVGAVEPHGPHAPLGTDLLISQGVCRRAARALAHDPALRALILPPLPYGVTRYADGFAGGITIRPETLHSLLVDICSALIAQGCPHIMVVNNHLEPEHVATLHRACDTVEAQTGCVVGYLDLTRRQRALRLTAEFQRGECHAGRYETSLMLADRPALVDRGAMAGLPPVPVSLVGDTGTGFRGRGMAQAYNGAPAEATAAEGEATFAILTQMLISLMREQVAGTGGRDRPGRGGSQIGGSQP
ncbi:MAG: crnA3 [Symbiobacteriaceae bacterium]|jgi:creatinine amidohydrolase|nr:crnA3 [Symbiobacteriaceae bacterium]